MEIKEKCEELKFAIGRYDQFYDSINNKGNLYLTINTFILGGIVAGFATMQDKCQLGNLLITFFVITAVANLVSFGLTLIAIKPHVSPTGGRVGSLIFFWDVAGYHEASYRKNWDEINLKKWYKDLRAQSQALAIGLRRKFFLLNLATWGIAAQVLIISIFGIILLNTKL